VDNARFHSVGLDQLGMPTTNDKITLRRHSISQLDTYDVTAYELDGIERECLDVGQDFHFTSNTLSIGVSFLIALVLTTIESPKIYACFFALVLVMGVLTLYFGIRYIRKRGATRSTIQRIRERQVGPVGDERLELRPSDLAALPVTQGGESQVVNLAVDAQDAINAPQVPAPATPNPAITSEAAASSGEQK
jgi:hypothetical protein